MPNHVRRPTSHVRVALGGPAGSGGRHCAEPTPWLRLGTPYLIVPGADMSVRRRGALTAVALAAALTLAACGGSSAGDTSASKDDNAKQADVATGGKDFGKA